MDSRFQSLIFVAIALFLFLHFPSISEAADSNDLLSSVCQQSDDFKSCLEVLKSNAKAASATNLNDVANAVMELARKETKDFGDFLKGLLESKDTNPEDKPSLKICADYINSSVVDFSLAGLEEGSASLDVHYALDNWEACERALAKDNVHVDSIADRMKSWRTFWSAAYASVVVLEG